MLILQLLNFLESCKFVYDNLCFLVRGFQKCGFVFLVLNFSPIFEKTEILTFFQKIVF